MLSKEAKGPSPWLTGVKQRSATNEDKVLCIATLCKPPLIELLRRPLACRSNRAGRIEDGYWPKVLWDGESVRVKPAWVPKILGANQSVLEGQRVSRLEITHQNKYTEGR